MRTNSKPSRQSGSGMRHYCGLPTILAVLAAFLAAPPAVAASAQMSSVSNGVVEITGGTGGHMWRLRYGVWANQGSSLPFVLAEGDKAWFANENWLRLIDTQKGVVIGRWHFPSHIKALIPKGSRLDVQLSSWSFENSQQIWTFDPAAPNVPYWPPSWPASVVVPLGEAQSPWHLWDSNRFSPIEKKIPDEEARRIIPELEETIRRDPLSPWFRVLLGKLLKDMGNPLAKTVFEGAVQVQSTDFTEMFQISSYLDLLGEPEASRTAFDRGYRSYLELGNDPRLYSDFFRRIWEYPLPHSFATWPIQRQEETMERIYRIAPYADGANVVWGHLATELEKHGRQEQAQLWRTRARDAAANSFYLKTLALARAFDLALLLFFASLGGALVYLLVTGARYGPQSRLDRAARERGSHLAGGFTWFTIAYWDRRQRFGFFAIILVGWIAAGLAAVVNQAMLRRDILSNSVENGTLAGPVLPQFLATQNLPSSPERTFLLAMAYQQNGDREKTEPLYRSIPQLPEAWNNLGVLLKDTGRADEARQAFERALQLDPQLAEAALNLGRPPQDFWTELHAKYLPARPMLSPLRLSRLVRAIWGGSAASLAQRALAGPFAIAGPEGAFSSVAEDLWALLHASYAMLPAGLFAIAILFLIPSREVTQSPGRLHFVWEILFPGTLPAWTYLGGFAFVAWSFFLIRGAVLSSTFNRYLVVASLPGFLVETFLDTYGISADSAGILHVFQPSWVWLYLAPALLFLVNLVMVLRSRRAH